MLIDAEHSYVQPAIDAIAMAMMQRFNQDGAKILTTYQCYLKASSSAPEIKHFASSRKMQRSYE